MAGAVVLTVRDLAERWAMTEWAVYDLVRRAVVPALRIGRRVRFRLVDIEKYEAAHVQPIASTGKPTTI